MGAPVTKTNAALWALPPALVMVSGFRWGWAEALITAVWYVAGTTAGLLLGWAMKRRAAR